VYVSDRIVFVELHKTGGSHIGKWLSRIVPGTQIGKHNRVPNELRDRFVMGSVRNPWDWYVSLWAYGCGGDGSVRQHTTRRIDLNYLNRQLGPEMGVRLPRPRVLLRQLAADLRRPIGLWRHLYSDVENPQLFREWLRLLLDWNRRYDCGEGFGFSPVSRWGGLLTYRYLKLFTGLDAALYSDQRLASADGARAVAHDSLLVRYVIRNENLEEDLLAGLAAAGVSVTTQQRQDILNAQAKKTNASRRQSTEYYLDDETRTLIGEREAFIVEAHGYAPPQL